MNILNIFVFFIHCLLLNGPVEQCLDFDRKNCELNSSVVYEISGPGFAIGDTPDVVRFEIQCKNGILKSYEIGILYRKEGTKIKKIEVSFSKRKYLKFWKKVIKADVWNLKTVTPVILTTEEELFREYKNLRMEQDNNKFKFYLGERNNTFEVYDLPMLKNPNYLLIAKEILALFNYELKDHYFLK